MDNERERDNEIREKIKKGESRLHKQFVSVLAGLVEGIAVAERSPPITLRHVCDGSYQTENRNTQ